VVMIVYALSGRYCKKRNKNSDSRRLVSGNVLRLSVSSYAPGSSLLVQFCVMISQYFTGNNHVVV